MLHPAKKNESTRPVYTEHDSLKKMHLHLAWALGTATIVLIINAVVVVVLVEAG